MGCSRAVAVVLSVGLMASACSTGRDAEFFSRGVGTDLHHASLDDATRLQDLYIEHICRQAGLTPRIAGGRSDCSDWELFVQAGMNDVDARCDAFLLWLDERRRSREPVLRQIADMRTAAVAIMSATGVGVAPIAVVSTAFGMSASSFANLNSRLLLELDQNTVQAVVLNRQRVFREGLRRHVIDNRPAAIHAMRSYLRICMPYTIELEINTTVTTFERGGARAVEQQRAAAPFITPNTIRRGRFTPPPAVPTTACPSGDDACLRLTRYLFRDGRRINAERRRQLSELLRSVAPDEQLMRVLRRPDRAPIRVRLLEQLRRTVPGA